jgi:type VI protein secretion system component VasK
MFEITISILGGILEIVSVVLGFVWDVVVWYLVFCWSIVCVVFGAIWSAFAAVVSFLVWPLLEPTFGPAVEHFKTHPFDLWVWGIISAVCTAFIVIFVVSLIDWQALAPEEQVRRTNEAKARRAEKRAVAVKRRAKRKAEIDLANDEHRKSCQRESDDYFAWKDQQGNQAGR